MFIKAGFIYETFSLRPIYSVSLKLNLSVLRGSILLLNRADFCAFYSFFLKNRTNKPLPAGYVKITI